MSFRTSRTATQLQYTDAKLGLLYGRDECVKRMWLLRDEALTAKAKFGPFHPTNKSQSRSKRLKWLAERWAERADQARIEEAV